MSRFSGARLHRVPTPPTIDNSEKPVFEVINCREVIEKMEVISSVEDKKAKINIPKIKINSPPIIKGQVISRDMKGLGLKC